MIRCLMCLRSATNYFQNLFSSQELTALKAQDYIPKCFILFEVKKKSRIGKCLAAKLNFNIIRSFDETKSNEAAAV